MPGTRKLGRPTAHRNAMLRGMVTYLLANGKIETTLTRAKEVSALTEKMITIGKKNTLAARRQALAFITSEDVVKKLFDVIAPDYADKNGGYVQIYKLGPRRGDGAEMALIRLVATEEQTAKAEEKKGDKKSSKKAKKSGRNEKSAKAEKETKPETATESEGAEKSEETETPAAPESLAAPETPAVPETEEPKPAPAETENT